MTTPARSIPCVAHDVPAGVDCPGGKPCAARCRAASVKTREENEKRREASKP